MAEDWQTGQAPQVGVPTTSGAIVKAESMGEPSDVEEHKWLAVIAYLGPLVFVSLLLGRRSPYARFHLNQGLVLAITLTVCWIVGLMLDFFLAFIPIVGWIVAACIPLTLFVTWLGLAVSGVLNAVNGRVRALPGIGHAFVVVR